MTTAPQPTQTEAPLRSKSLKGSLLAFSFILILVMVPGLCFGQSWSGILTPSHAIDWSASGIPGGIPSNRTQCGSTIQASTYGNGSSDATSGIQAALNACGASQFVLLGAGTFRIGSSLSVPSNVTLRGSGTQSTILNAVGTGSNSVITLGTAASSGDGPSPGSSVSITSGATAGSTSIVVASASGISTGSYLMITELNDPSFVTITTTNGTCSWCDSSMWSGTRVRGQIVEVESVSGTTIGISPGLYSSYSHTPLATPVPIGGKYVGLENLQIYANNTGYTANVQMTRCDYCWIKGIESNYADGDHVEANFSYRGEIRDSYFSNSFNHHSGGTDASVDIASKSSGFLVENNILERLHVSMMLEWGSAGNVFGYNFDIGNYDDTGDPNINHVQMMSINMHGAHPQFNLWEGNVTQKLDADGFWGSSSHSTAFRNWVKGTTPVAPYTDGSFTGRKPINWSAAWYPNQSNLGLNLAYIHSNYNFVGNVLGSTEVASVDSLFRSGPSNCPGCVISPANRNYQGTFYPLSFGYGTTSDSAGQCSSPASSCSSFATTFIHGNFDSPSNNIFWNVNGTGNQQLPASFYRATKPAWWGSLAWPAIGPDVTAGDGPGGHAYLKASNAAQACYYNTTKDSNGLLMFNPNSCYPSGSSGGTPPAAPSGLTAVVQ